MKLLIDIGHPAHVHFFKNFIWKMEERGHHIHITCRDKEVTQDLLRFYGFKFDSRGHLRRGLVQKAYGILEADYKIYCVARRMKPDIFLGFHNPYITHVAKLMKKPSIVFTDTENVGIASTLTYSFADVICTPSWFQESIDRRKHVRFKGFKELAYLHPRYFTPDISVLEDMEMAKTDRYIILRFISWGASHDIGLRGIKKGTELEFIRKLEAYGKVFITSERALPKHLDSYRIAIPPHKIHSLLHYADLYVGEGGTMAVEAAILGTPSIHIESDASGRPTGESSGNFLQLRNVYNLLYFFSTQESALQASVNIFEMKDAKQIWRKRRDVLLDSTIDVTRWMLDFIETYPESHDRLKQWKNNVVPSQDGI
ncbi:MAG: DUF354 domain-containing protein [Methanomicrobiales archaeon]|nr:DUF354 domain-containing protein [Methanomicrobiales archaeon]